MKIHDLHGVRMNLRMIARPLPAPVPLPEAPTRVYGRWYERSA